MLSRPQAHSAAGRIMSMEIFRCYTALDSMREDHMHYTTYISFSGNIHLVPDTVQAFRRWELWLSRLGWCSRLVPSMSVHGPNTVLGHRHHLPTERFIAEKCEHLCRGNSKTPKKASVLNYGHVGSDALQYGSYYADFGVVCCLYIQVKVLLHRRWSRKFHCREDCKSEFSDQQWD